MTIGISLSLLRKIPVIYLIYICCVAFLCCYVTVLNYESQVMESQYINNICNCIIIIILEVCKRYTGTQKREGATLLEEVDQRMFHKRTDTVMCIKEEAGGLQLEMRI